MSEPNENPAAGPSAPGATPSCEEEGERRVLVLAPFGRDAAEIGRVLDQAGWDARPCAGAEALCTEIARGTAAVVLAEEGLLEDGLRRLTAALAEQPAWSDLPLVVLTSRVREEGDGWHALPEIQETAHLILLERPLRRATLLSAVRAAARSRRRQYQVRDELAARKRAEQALRQSEALHRTFAANLPGGAAFILDRDLRYQLAAGRALEAVGFSSADFEGRTIWEACDPAVAQHREPLFRQVLAGVPFRHEHEDHGRCYLSEGVPIRDERGEVTHVLAVSYDITERKRAEQALRQSEATLSAVLDALPAGVIIADAEGRIVRDNAATRELWGVPPETTSWEQYGEWVGWRSGTGGRIEAPEWAMTRALRSGEVTRNELVQNQRFGSDERRYYLNNVAPLRDAEGRIVGGVAAMLDVTDRMAAEQALRELNETLEAQVAERTATARRRARDLRRLAAELSEAEHRERTRLARLLHDDLQQLILAAQLRLPVLADAPREQLLQHLDKIDEILGLCMRTSRSLSHELSPPVLQHGTLQDAIEWLGQWFGEQHGLAVAVRSPGLVPEMPEHLRVFLFHAVRELLFNVVKHSGRMEARVALLSRDGHLSIEVEDDGQGFDPAAVEVRLQRPEGFGLFNIQERLVALGGRMEIGRNPPGGARFRLVLPVAEAPALEPEGTGEDREEAAPRSTEDQRPEGSVLRLLIVDDHQVVREGLIGLLSRQKDIDVVGEAADGRQAVELAEDLRPDAILMDVDMPIMNGIEATRRIKQRSAQTVIVGLSLHEGAAVGRAMAEAGADAYVSKHAPGRQVAEVLRQACRREQSG